MDVPKAEPFSNQFFEGMSKIDELQPFLRDQMIADELSLPNTVRQAIAFFAS
ncbi:MAG: hypothetical protein ACSNEK_07170 [Parachlamydiaceae bacterium]